MCSPVVEGDTEEELAATLAQRELLLLQQKQQQQQQQQEAEEEEAVQRPAGPEIRSESTTRSVVAEEGRVAAGRQAETVVAGPGRFLVRVLGVRAMHRTGACVV